MIFFVNDPIAMHWKIQISKRTVSFDSVLVTTKMMLKKNTGGMDIWRTSCRGIGTNDCLCKNFLLLSFSCLPFFEPLISASPSTTVCRYKRKDFLLSNDVQLDSVEVISFSWKTFLCKFGVRSGCIVAGNQTRKICLLHTGKKRSFHIR